MLQQLFGVVGKLQGAATVTVAATAVMVQQWSKRQGAATVAVAATAVMAQQWSKRQGATERGVSDQQSESGPNSWDRR